ncbi:hypothetical protein [Aeromicrobium sp. Leaf291]|uniref:phage tail tube protein n=1 Tax=Aeromicrobium sp. Leaf291 TaxID=1736325 RepID=UPI0007016A25|nr:hypothetical protein [Aeromicrobium sp. Leaf291]KQP81571.1 hypothetical protein ASF35_16200 [Aeromicrobium sp. Leaf291]
MSTRFVRRGVSKYYWLTGVSDYRNITRSDLTGGIDLSDEIADISGWSLENQAASTPDMGSRFEKNIPGLDSASDSSITCYEPEEDPTGDEVDISAVLPKGEAGVFVILRRGDKPGSLSLDAFPARVASNSAEHSAGNDAARIVVQFTITTEPEQDQPVPVAA